MFDELLGMIFDLLFYGFPQIGLTILAIILLMLIIA